MAKRQTYLISFVGSDRRGVTTFGNEVIWLDDVMKATDIKEIKQTVAYKQRLVSVTILNTIPVKS